MQRSDNQWKQMINVTSPFVITSLDSWEKGKDWEGFLTDKSLMQSIIGLTDF